MSILLFHRNEHILQLCTRAAAIMLPSQTLLKLEENKPECEPELRELFAKLSASRKVGSSPANAYCVIEPVTPPGFYIQALVAPTREHIVLEAASEKFVENWGQVVTPERKAILAALGYDEPGPHSPNYRLEIPGVDAPSIDLAARIAALTLSEVFGAKTVANANVKMALPGETIMTSTLGSVSQWKPGTIVTPASKSGSASAPTTATPPGRFPQHPGIVDAPPKAYGKSYGFVGLPIPRPGTRSQSTPADGHKSL
jgi:hypothetical protein